MDSARLVCWSWSRLSFCVWSSSEVVLCENFQKWTLWHGSLLLMHLIKYSTSSTKLGGITSTWGRKLFDFQVALDRTRRWPWRVHHYHQRAFSVGLHSSLVDGLAVQNTQGWLEGLHWKVWWGHGGSYIAFAASSSPTAAGTCFQKQGDGLCVQCWDLLVLWHCRSTKACLGHCTWGKMWKNGKGQQGSE